MIKRAFILLGLVTLVPILMSAGWAASTQPSIKDNDYGTKVSLSIPGFLVRMGSWFVPRDEFDARYLLRKIGGVRVLVLEGGYYEKEKGDFDSYFAKLSSDGYEELLRIQSPEEKVQLAIKQDRKGTIRNLAVVVDDSESFVFARIKCHLKLDDLAKLIEGSDFDGLDMLKDEMGIEDIEPVAESKHNRHHSYDYDYPVPVQRSFIF